MDISCQFQEIGIVLTDDGFISVLEKMATSFVPQVKSDHIPGEKLLHAPGNGLAASSSQEMKMIR